MGLPIQTFLAKGINAVKLELIFEAGRTKESKKMVAQACGALMTEGSREYSSARLSEMVDYEGAHLFSGGGTDFISLKLISAKKSFSKMLDLLSSVLKAPLFDENEFLLFVERKKQNLALDLSKNDVIANRTITENLYGKDTAYGYNSTSEYLGEVRPEDLKKHYENHCISANAHLFLSGDFGKDHLSAVSNLSQIIRNTPNSLKTYKAIKTEKQKFVIPGREKQTSLKLGLRLFDRSHDDYPGLYLLNTILGGYFGSRLMKNIREEKGYTYNIYSMLDIYKYDGNWIISSDLNSANVENTIIEINNEFSRLKQQAISKGELEMVKNYLMGNFMSTINGPFKAINPNKTIQIMGLYENFYQRFFKTIKSMDKKGILELSNKYLHMDNFWNVIVGKA